MASLFTNNADPGSQASGGGPPSAGNSKVIPDSPAPSSFLSTVPEETAPLNIEEEVDRVMPPDLNIDLSLRTPAEIEKPPQQTEESNQEVPPPAEGPPAPSGKFQRMKARFRRMKALFRKIYKKEKLENAPQQAEESNPQVPPPQEGSPEQDPQSIIENPKAWCKEKFDNLKKKGERNKP